LTSLVTIPEIDKLVHEAQHLGHHLCMTYAISWALLQMHCVAAAAMSMEVVRAGGLTTFTKVPKESGTFGLPGARAGHVQMGQPARLNKECPF
jgi:hypothetical protein